MAAMAEGEAADVAKKLAKCSHSGRMVFAPVLNADEHLFSLDGNSQLKAAHVCSSAVVLPRANYATVLDRWRSISVLNGERPGNRIDPENVQPSTSSSDFVGFVSLVGWLVGSWKTTVAGRGEQLLHLRFAIVLITEIVQVFQLSCSRVMADASHEFGSTSHLREWYIWCRSFVRFVFTHLRA